MVEARRLRRQRNHPLLSQQYKSGTVQPNDLQNSPAAAQWVSSRNPSAAYGNTVDASLVPQADKALDSEPLTPLRGKDDDAEDYVWAFDSPGKAGAPGLHWIRGLSTRGDSNVDSDDVKDAIEDISQDKSGTCLTQ